MARVTNHWWEHLEQWRATAFLVGGLIFVVDTALLVVHMYSGTEPAAFGQALVGTSWTAAFIGLVGFYPSLTDRSRRLAKAGLVFAAIGGITMAAMAVTMFGYATDILSGTPSNVALYFLPGVFVGVVLGFGLFGVVSLRTDLYSRNLGLLFLLLPLTFLFNLGSGIAGFNPLAKVLGVVVVLSLTMLAIGYLLRTGSAFASRGDVEASTDMSAG
ncbi:hypothetical protein HWV23_13650 [Natronomonas halophila]|uniref:hypothetical protein n=1 Tax=Natronomonas halophila TaxID=2747817 RepID=UPI0015B61D7C|nr:hypothetical protein [Natronomonas halophila]QLD86729.1 hypothetical protein HWV23_13650 [Natronomonas halophila]